MDPKTKIKILRNGVSRGEYELWQIALLIKTGEVLSTDHYWHDGMTEWKLVTDIIKLAQKAEAEFKASFTKPSSISDKPKDDGDKKGNPTIGVIVFLIGILVLVDGLLTSPRDSAIRQAVLYQEMTNGILLMILGRIFYK
jgi:hypothetical protein